MEDAIEVAASETTAPRCARHPLVEAEAACARCGLFLCAECRPLGEQRGLCRGCVSLLERSGSPSALAIASAILGAGGVCLGFLPGVIALVLAQVELKRIARGDSSGAGRHWASAGRGLGLLNLVLAVVFGVAALLRF